MPLTKGSSQAQKLRSYHKLVLAIVFVLIVFALLHKRSGPARNGQQVSNPESASTHAANNVST